MLQISYSIVHATQFFASEGNRVRLAPVLIQPMAADDIASAVGEALPAPPLTIYA